MDTITRTQTTRTRQPAGSSQGGQFAPTAHDEAVGVDLADPAIIAQVEDSAAHMSMRVRGDADEIKSAALEDLVANEGRRKAKVSDGEPVTPIASPNAYVHMAVRHAAYRLPESDGVARWSVERTSMKELRRRVDEVQQENGRLMTGVERDGFAEEIRAQAPPQRRPREGFQTRNTFTDIDVASRIVPAPTDPMADRSSQTADERVEALIDRANESQVQRVLAARQLWDGLSAIRGDLPRIEVGTLSERRVAKARRDIASHDGAATIARAYTSGEASQEATDAMFLAFGGDACDDDERDAVVSVLTDHPDYADDVLNSALRQANRPR